MSNKYIHIWNESDEVSRIALEKLGLSSKRNDPSTIGQFGSGAKFAPIAALRNNWEWISTGKDSQGEYCMKYIVQIEDGVKCVAYDYGDYIKPSSFTLDAGVLSWTSNFNIYREAVANAIDEGSNGKQWGIDIVSEDEIRNIDGVFSVYITASPELMAYHNDYDKYFLTNRTSFYTESNVDFYEPINNQLRIYNHGVLVYSDDKQKSMFDYNIDSLILNEERNVRSLWEFEWEVSRSIVRCNNREIINFILERNDDGSILNYIESQRFNMHVINNEASYLWNECFTEKYPGNIVICDSSAYKQGIDTAVELRGYKLVCINADFLYSILINSGITPYTSILSEEYNFDIDYDISKYENVIRAMEIASYFEPGLNDFINDRRLGVFNSQVDYNLGMTINMNKEVSSRIILVNKIHTTDPISNIVSTLIHEYDHASTGFADGNDSGRKFRDLADKRIGEIMFHNFKETVYSLVDGMLEFPLGKLSSIGLNLNWLITKSNFTNKLMLHIGSSIVLINDNATYDSNPITSDIMGQLSVNKNGDALVINSLNNVTFVEQIK